MRSRLSLPSFDLRDFFAVGVGVRSEIPVVIACRGLNGGSFSDYRSSDAVWSTVGA